MLTGLWASCPLDAGKAVVTYCSMRSDDCCLLPWQHMHQFAYVLCTGEDSYCILLSTPQTWIIGYLLLRGTSGPFWKLSSAPEGFGLSRVTIPREQGCRYDLRDPVCVPTNPLPLQNAKPAPVIMNMPIQHH